MSSAGRQTAFGPIMQIAFVVDDLDATLAHWTGTMGVGPFYVFEHVRFQECHFRGDACEVDITAAIAYWGDIQVEFIKQHDTGPSIYTEFQAMGHPGMHHMGVMTPDLDQHLDRLKARGIAPVQWGSMPSGMRFAYVDSDFHPGGMIELIESGTAIVDYFKVMREAAERWDGSQPLIRV